MTYIEVLRRKANLNQEELAEKLGVTRQTVSRWENKHGNPTVDGYKAIAKVLGLEDWTVLTKEI